MPPDQWKSSNNQSDTVNTSEGPLFAGKFKILSKLGEGGMGSVYLVNHALLNTEFALKVLHSDGPSSVALTRRFQQEAKATFSLNHPNLVRVHEFGLSQIDEPYLVMDVVDGVTLADYLKTHGPMDVRTACLVMVQISSGIAHAHRMGIVHRDIKPGNIMLPKLISSHSLERPSAVKILDFGIAKITSGEGQALTRTGEVIGSPFYMSPEQCSGGLVDNHSDIYSLGCVFFEMLTGSPPHIGATAMRTMMLHVEEPVPSLKEATLGTQFPESVEQIVRQMMEKNPSRRIQTADDLHDQLTSMLASNFEKLAQDKLPGEGKINKRFFDARHPIVLVAGGLFIAILSSTLMHLADTNVKQSKDLSKLHGHNYPESQSSFSDASATSGQSSNFVNATSKRSSPATEQSVHQPGDSGDGETPESSLILDPKRVKEGDSYIRHFFFPSQTIAKISGTLKDYYPDVTTERQARGPVAMRDGDLVLTVDPQFPSQTTYIDKHSRLFSLLSQDAFVSLVIKTPAGLKEIGAMFGQASEANASAEVGQRRAQDRVVTTVLTAAESWHNLHVLDLESVVISDPQVAILEKIRNLVRFRLVSCKFDASKIAKLSWMKTLPRLELIDVPAGALIRGVSESAAFNELMLRDATSFSAADLASLSTCPKLDFVSLRQKKYSDEELEALISIPSLSSIVLETYTFSPKQISLLLSGRHLKYLLLPQVSKKTLDSAGIRDPRIEYKEL